MVLQYRADRRGMLVGKLIRARVLFQKAHLHKSGMDRGEADRQAGSNISAYRVFAFPLMMKKWQVGVFLICLRGDIIVYGGLHYQLLKRGVVLCFCFVFWLGFRCLVFLLVSVSGVVCCGCV